MQHQFGVWTWYLETKPMRLTRLDSRGSFTFTFPSATWSIYHLKGQTGPDGRIYDSDYFWLDLATDQSIVCEVPKRTIECRIDQKLTISSPHSLYGIRSALKVMLVPLETLASNIQK